MTIKFYRFDENLAVVDKGPCECDAALSILGSCAEKEPNTFETSEKAISETSFGLCKSEKDFIEISCEGNGLVSVHSDRLFYPSWLSRMIGFKHHFRIKGEKDTVENVIRDFYRMDRQDFEEKYSEYRCR